MDVQLPTESRPGARVLLFGPRGSVLLLHASIATRPDFWLCPGGGVEPGETWEQAAHREVREEAGLSITLGPRVWFRRHVYNDGGRDYDLFELYFMGWCASEQVTPRKQDSYIRGHRWWSMNELLASDAEFTPRRLKELILPLARGERPGKPFDCGI
jgi:8-oxo-dGTP pyrophosphatase MutT (NUDIX family)